MRSLFSKSILILSSITLVSCFDQSRPNYQYFPNMYMEGGYDTYEEHDVFPENQEALLPAEGSISRGWRPYEYENTNDGYDQAKAELTNPLPYTEENLNNGAQLYGIYCAVCHGNEGDGKGILVDREKILGVPSYDDPGRAITEGSVYHVMFYGRNAMGSYASQTTELERWQIDHYVMSLKDELEGNPERGFEDSEDDYEDVEMESIAPSVNAEETAIPEVLTEEANEENNTSNNQ